MLIIFGSRNIKTTAGSGQFNCPGCYADSSYLMKKSQRFFHVFWLPLFPIGKEVYYVECQNCKRSYEPVVIQNQHPVVQPGLVSAPGNPVAGQSGLNALSTSVYSGVPERIGAYLIDAIVTFFVWLMFMFVFLMFHGIPDKGTKDSVLQNYYIITMICIPLLYGTLLESLTGATLGKMVIKSKVVDENGDQVSVIKTFFRNLIKIVCWVFPPIYLVAAATGKKQAIHDLVAGTFVMRKDTMPNR